MARYVGFYLVVKKKNNQKSLQAGEKAWNRSFVLFLLLCGFNQQSHYDEQSRD